MSQDILEKRAQYVSKNNELTQEFYYADPATISKLNHAFNTHFYGTPVWDMFSTKFRKVEKAWNTSNRIIFSLPRTTHRYLIEPISDRSHIIFSLWKRLMKFTTSIALNQKVVLRNVFHIIKRDCRTITGRNLRNIMLASGNTLYDKKIHYCISKMKYHPIPDQESWRVHLIKELLDTERGISKIEDFTKEELDAIKDFACCK